MTTPIPAETLRAAEEAGRAWKERHALHNHEKYGCPYETNDIRDWAETVDVWRKRAIEAEAALAAALGTPR